MAMIIYCTIYHKVEMSIDTKMILPYTTYNVIHISIFIIYLLYALLNTMLSRCKLEYNPHIVYIFSRS